MPQEVPIQALPGLTEAVASVVRKAPYVEPRYVNDGDEVWIPWTSPEYPRRGLKCIVACAAGNHARVVNEKSVVPASRVTRIQHRPEGCMSNQYFIVTSDDRGRANIDGPFPEAEVLKRITPASAEVDGEDTYYGVGLQFLKELPDFSKTHDGENPIVIIKGEIIVPKAVQIATKFELPRK